MSVKKRCVAPALGRSNHRLVKYDLPKPIQILGGTMFLVENDGPRRQATIAILDLTVDDDAIETINRDPYVTCTKTAGIIQVTVRLAKGGIRDVDLFMETIREVILNPVKAVEDERDRTYKQSMRELEEAIQRGLAKKQHAA